MLSLKGVVFVGMISYTLYLWRVPADVLMRQVVGLEGWRLALSGCAPTFAAAIASYYLVERPLLRRRSEQQRLRATKTEVERPTTRWRDLVPKRGHERTRGEDRAT
jgi:peptidoglycan/LPS O-acetylase OafA/YrhL